MKYFLVEYDRVSQRSAVSMFFDAPPALRELSERERAKSPEVEVVLLMAESVEQLKLTHSRYFLTAGEMMDTLENSLAVPA